MVAASAAAVTVMSIKSYCHPREVADCDNGYDSGDGHCNRPHGGGQELGELGSFACKSEYENSCCENRLYNELFYFKQEECSCEKIECGDKRHNHHGCRHVHC